MEKETEIKTYTGFIKNGEDMSIENRYIVETDEVDSYLGSLWRCFIREKRKKKYTDFEIQIKDIN